MSLFLVRGGDSGIFPDPALRIALDEPPKQILGVTELVDNVALASFLGDCQFKYGGIAKAQGEHPGIQERVNQQPASALFVFGLIGTGCGFSLGLHP